MLDNKKIGKNILDLRKGQSLTQVELSNLLGVSHQAVSKWEQGECLPDIEVLLSLGQIFNKSVEEILLSARIAHDTAFPGEEVMESLDQSVIWTKALNELKKRVSTPSFNTWLKDTKSKYADGVYVIYSPNKFTTEWLYQRYSSLIIQTLEELTGRSDVKVAFQSTDTTNSGPGIIPNRAILITQSS